MRIIPLPDSLSGGTARADSLLRPFAGQLKVGPHDGCVLSTRGGGRSAVLLDFGTELCGGIELAAPLRASKKAAAVRVTLGESVSEALSRTDAPGTTATNDHSLRDFTIGVPWLGKVEAGNSGYRFALVELTEPDYELPLEAVRAVSRYRDLPRRGSFRSDNPRIDSIWEAGARTVHLNMQEYLWDGIKRDRLVWVGDLHPEVMTVANVFGDFDLVKQSLDFARDTSPLPQWMNGIAAYSMWWIIIQRDLALYGGDLDYLALQLPYLKGLAECLADGLDGDNENYGGAQRLLDWPTSEMPEVIHSGYQSLLLMAMEATADIARMTADEALGATSEAILERIRRHTPPASGAKQSAALALLADADTDRAKATEVILKDGPHGFSTFYGYYMLEALARQQAVPEALEIVSRYWGLMLDLGATTFWEDLVYEDGLRAARIDSPVPAGAYDIHRDGGAYCYEGLRHSLCHGWASGPTAWLSRHVLGVRPAAPGFSEVVIEPCLGSLRHAEGTVPTPRGDIYVSHTRRDDGTIESKIELPGGVKDVSRREGQER